jgi:transposase
MARSGPRRVQAYSREFKLTAFRLSQQPGLRMQAVAAALDTHPFMLSKWRKEVRDGVLRDKARSLAAPPRREIHWSGNGRR